MSTGTSRSTLRGLATSTARSAIKAAARSWDLLRHPQPGIVVLIYHRVGHGAGGQMDLEPAAFDRQLGWLATQSRVLSIDEAEQELRGGGPIEPGVVLTFDDGTTDWVDHVLPALESNGIPATFYVATDFVERGVAFPGEGRPISWTGLQELNGSPLVTLGSHTHRHVLLDRLPSTDVAEELDRSIGLLQEQLGTDVHHFAYPKAIAGSADAEQEVRKRFRTAVLAGTRANAVGTDLHRINRSPIQPSDTDRDFRHKAVGGMGMEDEIRSMANRVRYRGATT